MARVSKASKRKSVRKVKSPPALTSEQAIQGARNALAVANSSVDSQIQIYQSLSSAVAALKREKADSNQIEIFEDLAESRGRMLVQVVDRTLELAERTFEQNGVVQPLAQATKAALDVHSLVGTKGSVLATLKKKFAKFKSKSYSNKPVRPFFARFLENQNRQQAASSQASGAEIAVTMKSPSDHEDDFGTDAGKEVLVTLKFPSDQEDGGAVTEKFPSDEEDLGSDGVFVTMKSPSDHEDSGTDLTDVVFVTLKYPSDHDEGDTPVETRKFPSDQEDTGVNTLAVTAVTLKAPSDHEDGGDNSVPVTLKAPSDHEDNFAEPVQTRKFPSDAEDSGPGTDLAVTLKFPSDSEDGGCMGPCDLPKNPVTLKFPSDSDEGLPDDYLPPVTLKFPSDREDGGSIDPGEIITAKFPSDEEDNGQDLKTLMAVTLKFPSDNDEGDEGGCESNIATAKFPSDNDEVA